MNTNFESLSIPVEPSPGPPPIPPFDPTPAMIRSNVVLKLTKKFLPTLKKHNIKIYGAQHKQVQLSTVLVLLLISAKQNNENVNPSDYIKMVTNYTDLPDTTIENPQYYLPKSDYSFFLKFNGPSLTSKTVILDAEQEMINYLNSFYKKVNKYDGISSSTIALIILLSILIILVVIMIIVSAANNN